MNKKFLSVIMAALLAVSASAVCASAAEVEVEESKSSGTIKFDMGDWNHSDDLCFYIYDTSTTPTSCCSKNGWVDDNLWGSKKIKGTAVEGEDGIYESYEIDLSGREGHNIFVIFHDSTTSMQTYDCVLTADAFGQTARATGSSFENPVDSEKTGLEALFDGVDSSVCGPYKQITSTGNIVGYCQGPADDSATIVAEYVFDKVGKLDKSGVECCTIEKVDAAYASFGTDADAVWAKFQEFKNDSEKSAEYDSKEADCKKLIRPTEATESSTDTDSSSNSSNGSSSNGSSSNNSSSSGSSTKASTTASGSTTGTAATTDATATGDTTGTAVFAGVLAVAAGAIVLTRKKTQD